LIHILLAPVFQVNLDLGHLKSVYALHESWIKYRKDYQSYLKIEKSLSTNSVEAYLRDYDKFTQYLELHNSPQRPIDIGLEDYKSRFEIAFDNYDPIRLEPFFNIQRYLPEEGFKTYHCERAVLKSTPRVLVWMVYLNTVTHKGETEFLYQHHFESPEQGKLVIWPADWTYTHRGIPSPTQTKYILTGWFSLFNIEENE